VPDQLWEKIEPILKEHDPSKNTGRVHEFLHAQGEHGPLGEHHPKEDFRHHLRDLRYVFHAYYPLCLPAENRTPELSGAQTERAGHVPCRPESDVGALLDAAHGGHSQPRDPSWLSAGHPARLT
jgi:hypothetical protein